MLIHKANGQMTNIKVKTKKIPSEMEEAPPQKLLTPLRRLNTATTLLSLLKHCVYSSISDSKSVKISINLVFALEKIAKENR